MSTISAAFTELNKAEEYVSKQGEADYHVARAQVLALLAIAEQMEKTNEKEFIKAVVYNK